MPCEFISARDTCPVPAKHQMLHREPVSPTEHAGDKGRGEEEGDAEMTANKLFIYYSCAIRHQKEVNHPGGGAEENLR